MNVYKARIKSHRADEASARKVLGDYRHELEARRAAEFKAAGGCERCHGRCWVVVWDTLDSLSGCYAEFGPCPEAKAEAHGEGAPLDASRYSKYDRNRGVRIQEAVGDEVETLKALEAELRATERTVVEAENDAIPAFGKTIRVFKGRKVPVGTEGRVFWSGYGKYPGLRIGLETLDGEKLFTAASNCEVIGL